MEKFKVIVIGSGPASLGACFHLVSKGLSDILIIEKESMCSGGLRNDCKQNYTYPIGFPEDCWTKEQADLLLKEVKEHLNPRILPKKDIEIYTKRAEKVNTKLLEIEQAHVGTDKSKDLIKGLMNKLEEKGVTIKLKKEVTEVDYDMKTVTLGNGEKFSFDFLVIAPGRKGFSFLQKVMNEQKIEYIDNRVDVGIRVEARIENYPIVKDYYDPKFYFPNKVRTFCTNSGCASVVREKYGEYYLVNGHALSKEHGENGLVNFALLRTIGLKAPVRSGQQMAIFLARLANELGGGKPLMQRVGDFRMGKRSTMELFNDDLYDFKPSCVATAGDICLATPSKIMRDLWSSLKLLDTIVPGILHPSTILYYPEIKYYANKPSFINEYFEVKKGLYLVGDGAGTSRGITGAWASGIRAAKGILLS